MKKTSSIVIRAIEVLREEGVIVFSRKVLSYLGVTNAIIKVSLFLKLVLIPYALIKIKNFRHNNLIDLVDFSYNSKAVLIKPAQVRYEILELLRILNEIKPEVITEIGTYNGGTLFLISRVASEGATIISIDLPGGLFGGGYSKLKIPLYQSFSLPEQKIHLIRADSHSQTTLEKINNILDKKKIDFLFIDGDHTYEGVKKDFEMYSPLVKNNGIIAFHDIAAHPPETGCEVKKFWDQMKEKYNYIEIINDVNQGWGGIGILFLGNRMPTLFKMQNK